MSVNRIDQSVRMKVAIWASQNKEQLDGKTYKEAAAILETAIGVPVAVSVIASLYKVLEIKKAEKKGRPINRSPDHGKYAGRRSRVLAKLVRNLYEQLGVDVPEALKLLAHGDSLPDEPMAIEKDGQPLATEEQRMEIIWNTYRGLRDNGFHHSPTVAKLLDRNLVKEHEEGLFSSLKHRYDHKQNNSENLAKHL